jgi:hypothetical protein
VSIYRYSRQPEGPVERPEDPAVRKANLRRIIRLLGPFRSRLSIV